MVNVLASSVVGRGFEPQSGQTNDYENGICCFSAKHTAKTGWNRDNCVRVGRHVYPRTVVSVS